MLYNLVAVVVTVVVVGGGGGYIHYIRKVNSMRIVYERWSVHAVLQN